MRATLYVKGVRIKHVEDRSREAHYIGHKPMSDTPYVYPDYRVYKEVTYKSVLPEDQKALIRMAKAAAVKYGFKLTIIDVTESRLLSKLSTKLEGINTLPALVTDSGLKIEGDITEERIKVLLKQQTYGRRQTTTKNQIAEFFVLLTRRMYSVEMLFRLAMLLFCIGVFILTSIGLAVLYYRMFASSIWFVLVYIVAWVALPALILDFSRHRFSGKKVVPVLVLTLGVMLVSTLFTHSVWTIASPRWSLSVSTDKPTYKLGELVTITASLTNTGFIRHSFWSRQDGPILVAVYYGEPPPPNGYVVWINSLNRNISEFSVGPGETLERQFIWNQTNTWWNRIYMPGTLTIQVFISNDFANSIPFPLFSAWTSINITSG